MCCSRTQLLAAPVALTMAASSSSAQPQPQHLPLRSAEQTTRLLLSNAFHYDTQETEDNRRRLQHQKEHIHTVKIEFVKLLNEKKPSTAAIEAEEGATEKKKAEKEELTEQEKAKTASPPPPPVAIHVVLFDPEVQQFVGEPYRIPMESIHEPFVFQASAQQLVVVEVLAQRPRHQPPAISSSTPSTRATSWGYMKVGELTSPNTVWKLLPGTGQLLFLSRSMWPDEVKAGKGIAELQSRTNLSGDPALAHLMTELVPPGLVVPYSFAVDTPNPHATAFRVEIESVSMRPTSAASEVEKEEMRDPGVVWSVAVVAHNGYQQLSAGDEVPLGPPHHQWKHQQQLKAKKKEHQQRSHSSTQSATATSDDYYDEEDYSPYTDPTSKKHTGTTSNSYTYSQSSPVTAKKDGAAEGEPSLLSNLAIALENLPVHASTSLVLAIRRRLPGAEQAKVLGFCVFPLCLLPMKDRDLRVENLPALQGPFSCEDARMLLAEAGTPYGRLPYAITLSVSFFQTGVSGAVTLRTAEIDERKKKESSGSSTSSTPAQPPSALASPEDLKLFTPPPESQDPMGVDYSRSPSKRGSVRGEGGSSQQPGGVASSEHSAGGGRSSAATGRPDHRSASASRSLDSGVLQYLNRIMEELHQVRVLQEATLHASTGKNQLPHSPALMQRLNERLAGDDVDLIDLRPQPVAIPWHLRQKMSSAAQPILHPLSRLRLDEFAPAAPSCTRSLYGCRFEGITLDASMEMPEDLCFLFSFGPLPYQQVGPVQTALLKDETREGSSSALPSQQDLFHSYQFWDEQSNGGMVWCEPIDSSRDSVESFKKYSNHAVVYLHVYDALTMFYVCSAVLPLAHFLRPYSAGASLIPMDLSLQRDLSLTEQPVPDSVFPVILHVGQLHVTLFTIAVPQAPNAPASHRLIDASPGSRLVLAKKLPHLPQLSADTGRMLAAADDMGAAAPGQLGTVEGVRQTAHQRRVQLFKQSLQRQRDLGENSVDGVPDEHIQKVCADPQSLEYRLRVLEKERDASKSRAIASALQERLTVRHEVCVSAWRPMEVNTPFKNPYRTVVEFTVEILREFEGLCECPTPLWTLGPHEECSIRLILRLNKFNTSGESSGGQAASPPLTRLTVLARVLTQQRFLVRVVEMSAVVLPPIVDRRYELYGPPGSSAEKRLFSRQYTPAGIGHTGNTEELHKRLHLLCAAVSCSSPKTTSVSTSAMLDPVTQRYMTAWEEVRLRTVIPDAYGVQRVEYVTLYKDSEKTQVMEVWELCVFPCYAITTREVFWGQTTTIGLPMEDTEEMYCSNHRNRVETTAGGGGTDGSYLLSLRPSGVGVEKMLLHTLRNGTLIKTQLTVPVVYPTPTATQVIELVLDDVKGPVMRRLTFTHRGNREESFTIHHNYRYQLTVTPGRFILAPGESQHLHLRMEMLTLPAGQTEGRWPMWVFINDSKDKTVESYYLQVVLRLHAVAHLEEVNGGGKLLPVS